MKKKPTSMRLSPTALVLLGRLAHLWSISKVAALEVIIRDRAKEEGITEEGGQE